MGLILNIETTTKNSSVALANNGELVYCKEFQDHKLSHSELLHAFIEDVFEATTFSLSDIDAVAVSKGPGSFTGLRIGVSAAKGLCFSKDIPLISVDTNQAIATKVSVTEGLIVSLLDSKRNEVFSAVYNKNYKEVSPVIAEDLDNTSFKDLLRDNKVTFVGEASEKVSEYVSNENAVFTENALPSAKDMIKISYNKYKKSDTEDVAYFEPYYLKDFVAIKSKK
jgi:tRNA threonylcarbamoyladenosine biosynthesis protein TsaB